MSQEYTEDKHIRFKKLSSGRRLLEVILLAICLSAIFLMVALVSFSPSDPSWSQTTWNAPVKNLGGSVGSWSADILFSAFGILAFAIPILLLLGCWTIYHYESQRRYIDFFSLSLRLIGGLALILSSCGLAALNFDDLPNFSSGGVIGSVFSNAIMPWFNSLGATLALLFLWAISFTLFTGWSWLTIAEKIGAAVLIPLTLVTNRARGDDNDDYEVEEAEDALQRAQEAERQALDDMQADDDVLFSAPTISELASSQQIETEELPTETAPVEIVTPTASATPASTAEPEEELPSFSAIEQQEAYHFEVPDDYQPVLYDRDYQFKNVEPEQPVAQAQTETYTHQPTANERVNENVRHPVNDSRDQTTHWETPSHQPSASINSQGSEIATSSMPTSSVSDAVVQASGQSVADRLANPAALAAAGISVAALERHAQVKQNLEPELPRPNPVRLPTRRELYGIRIPSQRDAELQRRKEEAEQREQVYQQWSATDDKNHQQQQDDAEQENMLREQFLQQQRERYGVEEDGAEEDIHNELVEPTSSFSAQVQPQSETIDPVIPSYTQPEIEHRWPSAASPTEQVEQQTHQFKHVAHDFSAHDENEEADYRVEPKFDFSEHISVLDSFSPVDDLVNDEPADPLFMPSFSATAVSNPPSHPQEEDFNRNVTSALDTSASQGHTFAPQQ
ncbi:DNA translocase FtsK 4TM domain-containing protein, partial [Providencia stuartii]|nr:DNA translocase FtsK 4TM domain-containing protein [Providencia stuartii]